VSTDTNTPAHHPSRSGPAARLLVADQWAGRVHLATSCGAPHHHLIQEFPVSIDDWPQLRRILDEAGGLARSSGPTAVRVLRSPRGAVSVVRLHTPAWSLVMSAGRPVPAVLLAFVDIFPELIPLDLRDRDWWPELTAMTDAVLTALQ
jgi:hypothetical protein